MKGCLRLLCLFLLIAGMNFAQVVIRERVEIKPAPDISFNEEISPQEICEQLDGSYEIDISSGDDSTFAVWYGNCEDASLTLARCFHFYDWSDDWNVSIEGLEYVRPMLRGTGGEYYEIEESEWNYYSRTKLYLAFDKKHPTEATTVKFIFNHVSEDSADAVYSFNIYESYLYLESWGGNKEIEYGSTNTIDVDVYNQCGTDWPGLPDSIELIKEIFYGSEFGRINSHGEFVADGEMPEKDEIVVVKISTEDLSVYPIYVSYLIKTYKMYVKVEPSKIAPGDTARIIIQKENLDGSIEDFSINQTFEIGLIDGCDLGSLLTCYGGNCNRVLYSSALPQAYSIYYVANTYAGNGVATFRVGVAGESGGGVSSIKPSDEGKSSVTADDEFCYPGGFNSEFFVDVEVVVGEECGEKIEECDTCVQKEYTNELVEEFKENEEWTWTDEQNVEQRTNTGSACDYWIKPPPSNCDSIVYGKTYIMPHIGDFAQGVPVYSLLDDMKIYTCLDKSDPDNEYWQFFVDNIRVPIFCAHCPDMPSNCNMVDFEDGKNESLMRPYIQNIYDYLDLMALVDWWYKGAYKNNALKIPMPLNVYFNEGIIKHEKYHVKQIKVELPNEMNGPDGLPALQYFKLKKDEGTNCPSEAIAYQKEKIVNVIRYAVLEAGNLKEKFGKDEVTGEYISELKADYETRDIYITIKNNINLNFP